jgi:hypothetical protein
MRRARQSRTADCGTPAGRPAFDAGLIFLSFYPLSLPGGSLDAFKFSVLFACIGYHYLTMHTSEIHEAIEIGDHPSEIQRWAKWRPTVGIVLIVLGPLWLLFFDELLNSIFGVIGLPILAGGLHLCFSRVCPRCGKVNGRFDAKCGNCGYAQAMDNRFNV